MAITRRQFVTRMGALAAAAGFSQADVSRLAEAFAGHTPSMGGTFGKPRVIWIHGAECTGCSTSLLGVLEDGNGKPILGNNTLTTGAALGAAGVTNALGGAFPTLTGALRADGALVNIADVVVDVVDIQYHETIMGMGGDLAAKWLEDFIAEQGQIGGVDKPFVLVIEGAMQAKTSGGAWGDTHTEVPWCSIGMNDAGTVEHDMPEVVAALAAMNNCGLVIPIGQCACYGGYPGCKPQMSSAQAGFNATVSQTDAKGAYDFLSTYVGANQAAVRAAAAKVVAVPGCPTNPWWFVLTVVLYLAGMIDTATGLDYGRRVKNVYPIPVHSAYCPRYKFYNQGVYAMKPGDPGCLQKLGCKGIGTNSLCGAHGWNNQQPQNAGYLNFNGGRGGHCTAAGHPCMGCTEKGYPDSFVPFVKR